MMSGSVQNENGGHIVGKGKAPFIGGTEISPTPEEVAGFNAYIESYKAGLPVEEAAVRFKK